MSEETQSERVTEGLEGIDRLIHEPGRLAIMARLNVVEEADWLFLHYQTGLSFGNLASHLTRLEAVGYVESEKSFIDRKPHTVVRITAFGREAFETYRQGIMRMLDHD
jgi:DNA-binding MarR family transcriptional regulator